MTLVRITPPAVAAIAEADVLAHLRVDVETGSPAMDPPDIQLIRQYLAAAVESLDGPTGFLGRALITQTWRLKLPRFPAGGIKVPLPPVKEITAVVYWDQHGLDHVVDPTKYIVNGVGSDDVTIQPRSGAAWPATDDHPEAVEVTFVTGYGDSPADVPAPIRGAIMEMVATRYEHREALVVGFSAAALPVAARDVLGRFQSWGILADG